MRGNFAFRLLEKGVLPPSEKLALPIFPTPAWRVKSPLIRRFGEETAMGTYLKYARHRSFSPKPPSERQFDAPRQKLACARFGSFKKGALPLSAIGFANFAYPYRSLPIQCRTQKIRSENFRLRECRIGLSRANFACSQVFSVLGNNTLSCKK